MKKDKREERRAVYLQMLREAGKAGVLLTDMLKATEVTRTSRLWEILADEMTAGSVKKVGAATNRPARLYLAEHFPGLPGRKKRTERKPTKVSKREAQFLEHLRSLKEQGALMRELMIHFGISNQTASQYVQVLARKQLLIGQASGEGQCHREKRWYAAEFAPAFKIPKKAPEKKAVGLDPNAPAIIPKGLQVIRAAAPVERFAFDPPPGWRGCIDSSQSREWAKHAQR